MLSETMHPRIAELARELLALTDDPPERPTADDRMKLMVVRDKVKNLTDEPGIELSDSDETDRQYLYVVSTREANRQEAFWEQNDERWADETASVDS